MKIEVMGTPCENLTCDHPSFPDCQEPADFEVWEEEEDDSGISHYMCKCCLMDRFEEKIIKLT